MAAPHFNSEKKSHVYELLARLNASFARASRNLYELEKFGIFDAAMMTRIYNEAKEAQASANHHLLETLQKIEQRDWARFGKVRNDEGGRLKKH